jgi:hypothetical protein
MQINWLWFAVGLLPYYIKRQQMKDEQILAVKALYWRLTIHWQEGYCSWSVSIPFFEHLRQ